MHFHLSMDNTLDIDEEERNYYYDEHNVKIFI